MTAANSIRASGLVVDYPTSRGTVRGLECEGLRVEGGTSVAVMGPSGCGKSTLLGLLAGLALPTRGELQIGEALVSALDERARVRFRREELGMVYQADNLLPHLTVEENVALPLAICRSISAPARRSGPGEILERLGVGGLATRLPDQLSGGQRQRVAVARAVVHGPRVILADEPTGALDPRNAESVVALLVDVHRTIGATLMLVTHDPAIAGHMDRTILLRRPDPAALPGDLDAR